MNPLRTGQTEQNPGDQIGGERRSDRRYDLALNVRWKLIRRRRVLDSGTGKTVDVSSGGLLLETDRELPSGLNIELSISWPVLLHNVAPLQLVVAGRVVRATGQRIGVRMTQHEFRTMSIPAERRAELSLLPRTGMLAANGSGISSNGKAN
jgi:hypothetical protein